MTKILQKRIASREESILNEEQAGFRTGRGTTDQIFCFSLLIERMWEKDRNVFCLFIDFEKAFDSVWRPAMETILEWYGFDSNIVELIRNLNNETRATVRKGRIATDEFPIKRGVLQGCPLSPHLFNIFLEYVIRESLEGHEEDGICVSGQIINNLRYADDIVIVAESSEQLQRMANSVHRTCCKYKLKINASKTKAMVFSRRQELTLISLGATTVEQVDAFKYLGVHFSQDRNSMKSVKERISLGYAALGKLSKLWKDRHISLQLKLRLLTAIVIPTAIYGSECWLLKQTERNKLRAFEMNCLRRVLDIRWQDRIPNSTVRGMASGWRSIISVVEDQQRRWFGHVQRMDDRRWPRMLLYGRVHGARPRGRPRITWWSQLRAANSHIPSEVMIHLARDRDKWKQYRRSLWDPT
jgi:sorting nexin-29